MENETKILPNVPISRQTEKLIGEVASSIKGVLETQMQKFSPANIVSKLSGGNFAVMKTFDFLKDSVSDVFETVQSRFKKVDDDKDTNSDDSDKRDDTVQKQTDVLGNLVERSNTILDSMSETVNDLHNIIYAMLRRNRNERLSELEKEREARLKKDQQHEEVVDALNGIGDEKSKVEGEEGGAKSKHLFGLFTGMKIGALMSGLSASIGVWLKTLFGAKGKILKGLGSIFSGLFKFLPGILLKGFMRLNLIALIVGGLFSGFEGGLKTWNETHDWSKTIDGFFGGIIEFFTFGLIKRKDYVELMDKIKTSIMEFDYSGFFNGLFTSAKDGVKFAIKSAIDFVMAKITSLNLEIQKAFGIDLIASVKKWVSDLIKPIMDFFTNNEEDQKGRRSAFKIMVDGAMAKFNIWLSDLFKPITELLDTLGKGQFIKAFSQIGKIISDIAKWYVGIYTSIWNYIKEKIESIPIVGKMFSSKTPEEKKEEARTDVVVAKKRVEKEGVVETARSKQMKKQLAAAEARLQRIADDDLMEARVQRVPPESESRIKRITDVTSENRQMMDDIDDRSNSEGSPTVVNAPSTITNNQDTIAIIGTGTGNSDRTVQDQIIRGYMLSGGGP
jgi:hypothetical protein